MFPLFIIIIFLLAMYPLYDVPPYKIHALLHCITISMDMPITNYYRQQSTEFKIQVAGTLYRIFLTE
jgi:hypothetical protein